MGNGSITAAVSCYPTCVQRADTLMPSALPAMVILFRIIDAWLEEQGASGFSGGGVSVGGLTYTCTHGKRRNH